MHGGTLVGAQGLELIPGVSRGIYELELPAVAPFTRALASLNPEPFPVGAGVRLLARVRRQAGWSRWASLGIYGSGRDLPQSEASPESEGVAVQDDLLCSDAPADALAFRLELEAGELGGTPQVRRLAFATWDPADPPADAPPLEAAWGQELELNPRSQRALPAELSERACSPTSLAMVLSFHGCAQEPEAVARAVFDHGAQLYGNWSFNVAHAASLGLEATAFRGSSLATLEAEVLAGRPVVISHSHAAGELPESPLESTPGHLLVVAGFTPTGDLRVYDPAADPAQGQPVRRTYPRAALEQSWLQRGSGVGYRILPREN